MKNNMTTTRKSAAGVRSRLRLLKLEPRMLFDGAALVEAVDATTQAQPVQAPLLDVHVLDQATAPVLDSAEKQVEQQVAAFLQQPNASQTLFSLFNGGKDAPNAQWTAAVETLLKSVTDGTASLRVELLSNAEMRGAFGAFAAQGPDGKPIIYLNAEWVKGGATAGDVARVMLEELGHSIDTALNGAADTPGDEGEAFAMNVLGTQLSDATRSRIAQENDHGTITVDGQSYEVEDASITFSLVYRGTPSALSEEAQMLGNIQPFAGSNFRFVSSNPTDPYFSGNNVTGWLVYTDTNNVEQSVYGVVSRLFKTGSVVEGFYFYATGADGVIGTGDAGETAYALVMDPSKFATNGSYGTSSDPVDTALNNVLNNYTPPAAIADTSDSNGALAAIEQGNNVTTRDATGNVLTNDVGSNSPSVSGIGTSATSLATVSDATAATAFAANHGLAGAYGTLYIGADGTYKYVVNNANTAVNALRQATDKLYDTYTYRITDNKGHTATTTLKVTIQGSNDAPVAVNDYNTAKVSLLADGTEYGATDPLGVKASGNVLTNDTDVDKYGETKTLIGLTATATTASFSTGGTTTSLAFSSSQGQSLNAVSVGAYVYRESVSGNTTTYTLLKDSSNVAITVTAKVKNADGSYSISLSGSPNGYTIANGSAVDFYSPGGNGSPPDTSTNLNSKRATVTTATSVERSTATVTVAAGEYLSVGMTVTADSNGAAVGAKITALTAGSNGQMVVTLDKILNATPGTLTFSAAAGSTVNGAYGTLILSADGSGTYTYTPTSGVLTAGQTGTETFSYTMMDAGGATSKATLTITVLGSSSTDPKAANDTATVTENTNGTSGTPNVLTNDTAGSGTISVIGATSVTESKSISSGSSATFKGAYGTLTLCANGQYAYALDNTNPSVDTLNVGTSLTDSFQYTIRNTATTPGTSVATLTITINGANDAPVAANDTLTATEDTPTTFTASQLLDNDTDVDGGTLVIQSVTSGTGGTAVLNQNGTVTFTPASNFNGMATFSYVVSDGKGGTATASVSVTVDPVNDAPVARNNTYVATEDALLTGKNLLTDVDPLTGQDTDVETATSALSVAKVNGVLFTANGTDAAHFAANGWMQVNLAHGTLYIKQDGTTEYKATPNSTSGDTFTYVATDGTDESNAATVSFTVTPVVDLSAADDTGGMNEDTALNGSVSNNDSTSSGGALSFSKTTDPAHGTLAFNSDGSYLYTPAANYNGTDSFTYTVSDSASGESLTRTVYLTINPVADLSANNDTVETASNTPVTDSVASNDSSTTGATLSFTKTTNPAHGSVVFAANGAYTYTPSPGFSGTDSFTYTVTDPVAGESLTRTVAITVNAPTSNLSASNDAVSTNEDTSVGGNVALNDSTTSGGPLAFTKTTDPAHGAVIFNADGTFAYTPDADFNGTDTFSYTVTDSSGAHESLTKTVTITVLPQNDAALIGGADTGSVTEDASSPTLSDTGNLSITDADTGEASFDSSSVTFDAAHSSRTALGSLSIDSAGAWTYSVANADVQYLAAGQSETLKYVVTSADGTTHTVTITIQGANDAAVISGANTGLVTEDASSPTLSDTGNLSITDADTGEASFDSSSVTFDAAHSSRTALGSLSIDSAGAWTYSVANADVQYLAAGQSETLKYVVTSADGTTHTVTITIQGVNNAAVISGADTGLVTEDASSPTLTESGNLSITDADTGEASFDSSSVTFDAAHSSRTALGSLSIDSAGAWTYSVANADVQYLAAGQSETLKYVVASADGTTHTVTITIQGVNDVAVIGPGLDSDSDGTPDAAQGEVTEDTNLIGNLLHASGTLNITDADAGQAKFDTTVTPMPGAWGTLTITETGAWSYMADNNRQELQALRAGESRTETFTVRSLDGTGTQLISVVIHGAADPLQVSSPVVNEASPYAVFTVSGLPAQDLTLNLSQSGSASGNGTDYGSAGNTNLEVFVNGTWTPYSTSILLPQSGVLLVRTPIIDDTVSDDGETFSLTATPTGGPSAAGTATIRDNGTGDIYQPDGQIDLAAQRTDDRPISVSNITVNEASPYAVFNVTGAPGQTFALTLAADTATGTGVDFGSAVTRNLEVSLDGGQTWSSHIAGVVMPGNGQLLVRTPVVEDNIQDNGESFRLTASVRGGNTAVGVATIDDLGAGTIFNEDGSENLAAPKSSDLPPPIQPSPPTPPETLPLIQPPVVYSPLPTVTVTPVVLEPVSPIANQFASPNPSYDPSSHVLAAVNEARLETLGEGSATNNVLTHVGAGLGMDPALYVLPAVANVGTDVRAVARSIEAVSGSFSADGATELLGLDPINTSPGLTLPPASEAPNRDAVSPQNSLEAPAASDESVRSSAQMEASKALAEPSSQQADTPRSTARRSFSDQLRSAAENRSVRNNTLRSPTNDTRFANSGKTTSRA